jgi:peptidoglycan pentaglycine glycine transferase (the first glycine)
MDIKDCKHNPEWQDFIQQINPSTFLQNQTWREFQENLGNHTWQLGLFDGEKLISTALVSKTSAKRGIFLQCLHGPIASQPTKEMMQIWTEYLRDLGKQERAAFVRVAPVWPDTEENQKVLSETGWQKAPIHAMHELTLIVDITPESSLLLKSMSNNTQRKIKKGLKLVEAGELSVEYAQSFTPQHWEVYTHTSKRGHFVPFNQKYLSTEFATFHEHNQAELITIKHEGELLSWVMVIFSGTHAFFHHGANILSTQYPSSDLAHWLAIQKAQEHQCTTYDFWGVSPESAVKHPWASFSRFKRGFGGYDQATIPAYDLPLNSWYQATYWFEKLRAWKRGF